ncbi:substrate-binding domain-containing protein [Rhizobium leguminosarum]|uniref:LacI family DNA-binding transcriptional regulator n=1 Tax=Rhizobium leguminosarum TaxID=384 RepID=UPI001C96C8A0|nr:LacI family DNA-binding transcriptional regulator [Rhizobium leguminosarum]MBY5460835.1 substrate-binding domain-containing protein [Rhizobium leguminosarum]
MARITIADIVKESGLSRATVDRALNRRVGVHSRTKALVEAAVQRLSRTSDVVPDWPTVELALRIGRGLMSQLKVSAEKLDAGELDVHDLYQMDDAAVLTRIRNLCQDVSRPLVLTVKNTPQLVAELARARRRGKTVVALVSDLDQMARDAYVGIDNRAAGQTASFLIGRMLGDRPTTVGVVLGNHAYRCHEDREIGFRSALRAHFPKVVLVAEAVGQDDPTKTHAAVRRMLEEYPGIGAIYNVAGGNLGLVKALKEAGRAYDLLIVGHEANHITVPLMQEGVIDFVIAQKPGELLAGAIHQARLTKMERDNDQLLVDFAVVTRFNLPEYGLDAGD